MSDQLAYKRVWQRYMLGTGTFVTRTAREGPPVRLGSYHGLPTDPRKDHGGPLHIPLRAVIPAKKDVLASQRVSGKGVPQASQQTR